MGGAEEALEGGLGRSLPLLTCREPVYRSDFRRQDAVQPHSLTGRVGLAPYLRIIFQCLI